MIVGFTCSSFDLFHAGHVSMLNYAKRHCDYLVVGLQVDPTIDRNEKNKPVQSLLERFVQVSACKYVDEVIPYETEADLELLLMTLLPDKRFIGEEYINKKITGSEICESQGTEIIYTHRRHNLSTSELRNRIKGQ